MTDINKQNLIEQIDAAISALDVPNDATQELSFYIKTAINAGTSISDIGTEIASRVASIDTLSDVEEVLLLSVATSLITRDRMVTVSDLATLQGFSSDISVGSIYYVESEGAPYIKKTNGTWVLLDPSIQPLATINGWAWGENVNGKLGDGTTIIRSSPVSIIGGFSDWIQLSCGTNGSFNLSNSFGVRNNGTAWAWGDNSSLSGLGILGDGTTTNKSSPVLIAGGFTDWVQISGGSEHALGVRANGTLWAWGEASFGKLGNGDDVTNRSSPVSVVGGFEDWVQASAGLWHSLALRSNGTIWGMGVNSSGELGINSGSDKSSPVSVIGGFTDWIQVSASSRFTSFGLRANGTAWAWGRSTDGLLGDGTTVNKSSPVSVVGGFTDWSSIQGGRTHCLALRANGTMWAWGNGYAGKLGDGSTVNKSSPVSVVGGYTDWVSMSGGGAFSVGIRANGTAWAWGHAYKGNLGTGNVSGRSSPVSVVGGFTDWVQVSAGYSHSLGVRIA